MALALVGLYSVSSTQPDQQNVSLCNFSHAMPDPMH